MTSTFRYCLGLLLQTVTAVFCGKAGEKLFGKSQSSFLEQQLLTEKLLLEKACPPGSHAFGKSCFQLLQEAVTNFTIKPHNKKYFFYIIT